MDPSQQHRNVGIRRKVCDIPLSFILGWFRDISRKCILRRRNTHGQFAANAVRILSLTPPGVKVRDIFKKIEDDIVQGMSEGFLDFDAEGVKRRIFLNLVGYLGDTPAVNGELDTLGHTANAFCLLCRYKRNTIGLLGSR